MPSQDSSLSPVLADLDSTPVLDQEQVDLLLESGGDAGAELLAELRDLFVSENGAHLEGLEEATKSSDRDGMIKHSHALAGSSANVGGLRLSTLCRRLENASASGEVSAVADSLARLREEFDALDVALGEVVEANS